MPAQRHCCLIGTCLPVAEMRKLAARAGYDAKDMSDYSLHAVVTGYCNERRESEVLPAVWPCSVAKPRRASRSPYSPVNTSANPPSLGVLNVNETPLVTDRSHEQPPARMVAGALAHLAVHMSAGCPRSALLAAMLLERVASDPEADNHLRRHARELVEILERDPLTLAAAPPSWADAGGHPASLAS